MGDELQKEEIREVLGKELELLINFKLLVFNLNYI